ncbi:VPLPA-CTERM sorting domain-containing protein [Dinoroseobacter sp. S76]|uniref:VPLPA-CTERM sorting domain-containing protein n=1 Tax=Dinoroseobacter sp. S76 TaxID=3415124 RepID=UPI003C7E5DA7
MIRPLLAAGLLALNFAAPASAAITQYADYADFTSLTIVGATGRDIDDSTDFTSNAAGGFNGPISEEGVGTFPVSTDPMVFTKVLAYEVGMTFGNDQSAPGTQYTGIFDVVLRAYSGTDFVGSVTVVSNGNDLSDQFIGFGSTTPFDRVELDYEGTASRGLARFITEVQFGLDPVAPIPLPAGLPLLLAGLGGLGLLRRRRA